MMYNDVYLIERETRQGRQEGWQVTMRGREVERRVSF